MSVPSVPADLFNPGQVFACLGFVELTELLVGPCFGGFDWSDPGGARFLLTCDGVADPFARALEFLAAAEVRSIAPHGSELTTEERSVETTALGEGEPFPIPTPDSPATLPAILSAQGHALCLHSWGEGSIPGKLTPRRDNVKFWAGANGYPGAGLVRDAFALVRKAPDARDDPFNLAAPQSSSFRFDWRHDYIAIDIGFSLNAHTTMTSRGYPLVELLALIGLSHARPVRRTKLRYEYFVRGRDRHEPDAALMPAPLLRASLGAPSLPFPTRHFTMHLDWPGQENQARCITSVDEENAE